MTLPPAARLTLHQPPALLVAAVEGIGPGPGRVGLLPHQGLDGWQLLEACAQAVAVLAGAANAQAPAGPAGPRGGRLVAAKDFVLSRPARSGEQVVVEVRTGAQLGALALYAVRACAGEEELARGELTIAHDALHADDARDGHGAPDAPGLPGRTSA
jgi:hypothetical protein